MAISRIFWEVVGIATPVCALVRNDVEERTPGQAWKIVKISFQEFLNTFEKIFIINKGETNNVFRT